MFSSHHLCFYRFLFVLSSWQIITRKSFWLSIKATRNRMQRDCSACPAQPILRCWNWIACSCISKEQNYLWFTEQGCHKAMMCVMKCRNALIRFVQGEKDTSWTWQQCLEYSIRLMNNLGIIEAFSTLKALFGRWNRRFAYNIQCNFCKSTINCDKPAPTILWSE